MGMIVIQPAALAARTAALATLEGILRYVTVNRFSLFALTKVLMREGDAAALHAQLEWLARNGYLVKDSPASSIYTCTLKGRAYEPDDTLEDENGFTIEFSASPDEPESSVEPRVLE